MEYEEYLDKNGKPVAVTICPPGRALGVNDLAQWASRRAGGFTGTTKRIEKITRDEIKKYKKSQRKKNRKVHFIDREARRVLLNDQKLFEERMAREICDQFVTS
jgi:hypothetical protein